MTPDERRARGERADMVLKNDVFQETFAELEAEYVKAWRNGKAVEDRERAFTFLKTLERVKEHIETVARTGAMADAQLKALQAQQNKGLGLRSYITR